MKQPKIVAKVSKQKDLEIHVRQAWIGGYEFVELRDYIPSLKAYSRGMVIERHLLPQVIEALEAAK